MPLRIGAESSIGMWDNPRPKALPDGTDTVVCKGDQVGPTRAIDTILTTAQEPHKMEIIGGYPGTVFTGAKKKARFELSGLVNGCGFQELYCRLMEAI
jgi:hypothetical protein